MTKAINSAELKAELDNLSNAKFLHPKEIATIVAAARAHLATLPKPDKTITVWAVDWVFKTRSAFSSIVRWVPQCTICSTQAEAEQWVRDHEGNDQIRNMRIREIEREIPDDD